MTVFMVNDDQAQRSMLYVILAKENVERMAQADPAVLPSTSAGGLIETVKYPANFYIFLCYEPDTGLLMEALSEGNTAHLMSFLLRGYKVLETDGQEICNFRLEPRPLT
jgi:hypothetical protein